MKNDLDSLDILEIPDFFEVYDKLLEYEEAPNISKMRLMMFWAEKVLESHTKHSSMYDDINQDLKLAKQFVNTDTKSAQHYANEYYQACINWLRNSDETKYYECEKHHSDFVNAIRMAQMISYIRRNEVKGFVHCGLIFWATYKNFNKVFTS